MEEATIELLEAKDISLLKSIIENDNKTFSSEKIERFLRSKSNYAFIIKAKAWIVGLAYCYSLERLDERGPMLYIHSVGILPQYQNAGLGTKLMNHIVTYAKENGFSECFVITGKSNKRACRVYEKSGGKAVNDDDIVYVMDTEN